jgi:hypothetical protein
MLAALQFKDISSAQSQVMNEVHEAGNSAVVITPDKIKDNVIVFNIQQVTHFN